MADQRYWDSDCFLGWLQAEDDKEKECRAVLEAAKDGKVLIVTSALTLAEVLMLKGKKPIPSGNRAKVEAFFRSDFIVVRNISRRIAELGRGLVWDHKIAPKDALHVATALDARLPLFNTFDARLINKWRRANAFTMIVERPQVAEPKLPFGGP
jgi:predicted nucleic acid-binding protein